MVSMTGSVGAGEKIMAAAAKNITKVCLELGGKAPAIVMDDADLELAVKAVVDSGSLTAGRCVTAWSGSMCKKAFTIAL
jgi:lactaldehyde dehydrogenase/glycolaldehyde dehydrogenase